MLAPLGSECDLEPERFPPLNGYVDGLILIIPDRLITRVRKQLER